MADTVGVLVPAEHIAKVIGKAGAGLKSIREATGVKVQVQQASDAASGARRVDLSGGAEQIVGGFQLILSKAFSEAYSSLTLMIPAEKAGQAVGRGGANLRKVREQCRVRMALERELLQDPTTGHQERLLTMQGEVPQMARALGHVLGAETAGFFGAAMVPTSPVVAGFSQLALMCAPSAAGFLSQVRPVSADPEEIQLHFSVPDRYAGAILGKGGAQMKQTAAAAGCRICMTTRDVGCERRAVMLGTYSQCSIAQNLLYEQLVEAARAVGEEIGEVTVTFMIRKEAAGAVIGGQGACLKQVREQSGAKIQLAREEVEGQRPCTITGSLQAVIQAEKGIFEIMRQVPIESAADGTTYSGGTYTGGFLPDYSARVNGHEWNAAGGVEDVTALAQTAKRQRVDETEKVTKLLVPAQSAGAVIQRQASGLKEIRESTGAHVEMLQHGQAPQWPNDRLVLLRGSADARQGAVFTVLKKAFHADADPGNPRLKLLVSPAQAGALIGRQGGTLKRIREQCGISVQVEREEVLGERLVTATGSHSQVSAAVAAVLAVLEDTGSGAPSSHAGPAEPGGAAPVRAEPQAEDESAVACAAYDPEAAPEAGQWPL